LGGTFAITVIGHGGHIIDDDDDDDDDDPLLQGGVMIDVQDKQLSSDFIRLDLAVSFSRHSLNRSLSLFSNENVDIKPFSCRSLQNLPIKLTLSPKKHDLGLPFCSLP